MLKTRDKNINSGSEEILGSREHGMVKDGYSVFCVGFLLLLFVCFFNEEFLIR